MSEASGTETSGSSFSSAGGSSLASDNTDTRALTSLQEGPDGEAGDDLGSNNKSIQEGIFSTLYTLTKNRAMDTSLRIAALRVVLEFLQFFRVAVNFSFPWHIQRDLWVFKAIEWILFRALLVRQGYKEYIIVFYVLIAVIVATLLLTVWVALVLKGSDTVNVWLKRLVGFLQLVALVVYCVAWPVVMDYCVFLFDCKWTNIAQGQAAVHVYFTEQSCTAMPHLAHMCVAGLGVLVLAGMVLLMGMGVCDMNPLNRSILSSSDDVTSIKMLLLKMVFVIVSTMLDQIASIQVVIMAVAMFGVVYYLFVGVPFYRKTVNCIWGGLWVGMLDVVVILVVLQLTKDQQADPAAYAHLMTQVMLWSIFPAVAVGAGLMWLRLWQLQRVSKALGNSFNVCKAAVLANMVAGEGVDDEGKARGGSAVALMGDLKRVFRFMDERQVKIACRDMRHWDEDEQPQPDAIEFGEFVLKCGMARMPSNPALLVVYASFLIEARKDGQAARTQLQLAQKANPSVLAQYHIYVAQQLAKQLKRDGDGLDLLSYVEFQRNYLACVRSHKMALTAQRAFWNCLLRDTISFKDLQANVKGMEAAEQRATAVYRRVLDRYPGNGKVMKVYGRFLEFVRNEPGAAARFYEAAIKAGTTESLLALTAAEGGAAGLSAAGQIDEKTDGLAVINAQGTIMMVNNATLNLFGYQKGELEGKNVSVLMPQPYSTRHDTFLQRYVETNQPHILNTTRPVVALHKDRSMFPLSLCVARLSGVGMDTLFIGVMRREVAIGKSDNRVLRVWTTQAGTIMCADSSITDTLGIAAGDLVGRSFSNLCTDVEGVNRYLATASMAAGSADDSGAVTSGAVFKTKMLHGFLPAVEVELSVQFGGAVEAGSDYRSMIVHARVLSEAAAVMVVDHRGRIMHATAKLSTLLGHLVANLTKMELNSLLPQPVCQMHSAWFKDPPQRVPSTSCRAGGVVHLLAANGTKVPVTLKLSTKEDGNTGHSSHIIQVTKASEEQRLDQQRMLLSINHRGVILAVNPGVPKSLFGFDGLQLVGQPLSAIIDVFTDWKAACGEELSLLELLVGQVLAATADGAAGKAAASSWRVGVHRPVADAHDSSEQAGLSSTHGSSLLHALQPNRVQPACMKLEPIVQEAGDLLLTGAGADTVPVLQVSLHRSDALTAVLDLDSNLHVGRADESVGLMFGVTPKQLVRTPFTKLVGLPDAKHFDDLLGSGKHAAAKKGAMKTAAAASRAGVIKRVTATHLGDGQPLSLNMQAMTYDQGGRTRRVVRLQLVNPVSAAMQRLLAIKDGKGAAAAGGKDTAAEAGSESDSPHSPSSSAKGSEHGAGSPAKLLSSQPALKPAGGKARDRTGDWVRQASELREAPDEDEALDEQPAATGRSPGQHSKLGGGHHHHAKLGDGEVAVSLRLPAGGGGGLGKGQQQQMSLAGKSTHFGGSQDGSSEDDGLTRQNSCFSLPDRHAGDAPSEGGSSFAGSMADGGMSDGGASGIESSVTGGGMGHDEELAVDTRRVKRLKKLQRMLVSSVAQAATSAWKRNTLVLLAVVLVAHIACFAVITTQLEARYANAVSVNTIALSMAAASQAVLRINFVSKCQMPEFQDMFVCQPASVKDYGTRLASNTAKFRTHHHNLYLGGDGLQPFRDPRLIDFWTYMPLPEVAYYRVMGDGQPAFVNSTRTLWEMGNVLLEALETVHWFKDSMTGAALELTPAWQYAYINGPASVFSGYAWSLDTFVDYTWQDLTKLSAVIIVLLVIEAVVVQLSCMAYEFVLLQRCNVSHMRLFSVFLALPSATVRFMVRRPMVVDDSTNDDADDDDLDLVEGAAAAGPGANTTSGAAGDGAAAEAGAGTAPDKKKSVRLAAADDDDDEDGAAKPGAAKDKEGRSSLRSKSKANPAKKAKPPLGAFAAFRKSAHKQLLGWLDPRFKRNGKKLSPSSRIIAHIMVPLLLWVAVVVVIFGISYSNLQGLQAPLASLDLSAHVMYRLTRARLIANMLAFSLSQASNDFYRQELKDELGLLRQEYRSLLYGGPMLLQANVTFDTVAPPAIFGNKDVADIFFKTTDCLRNDQSTCWQPGSEYYDITHSGLDSQMQRYLDEMTAFSNVPNELAYANHTSYEFTSKVTAHDTYEGLQKASGLFVANTLDKLNSVKELHIILLVISLLGMVLFVALLYRPYIKVLRRDTKAVINMLSQLPAEVDVEGQVKAIVLGIAKTDGGGRSMQGGMEGQPLGSMQLQPYGSGPPAGYYGAGSGHSNNPNNTNGWFGRRGSGSNFGPQQQQGPGNNNDAQQMYGYGGGGMHGNNMQQQYGGYGGDMMA